MMLSKSSFIRTSLIFLFLVLCVIVTPFLFALNKLDDSKYYNDAGAKADAGVILGAAVWSGNRPSPLLKERINKGYEVYNKGIVPKLVITGGASPNEMTEADVAKDLLLKYGVNPNDLIEENSSSSTIEQIQFVRDKLYNTKNWNKIILISDNFHLMRALEICKFNDINADSIASDIELSTEGSISYYMKESLGLIIFWMFGI